MAGLEAADMVEDVGALGEVAEGDALECRGDDVEVGKELADAGDDDFEFDCAGSAEIPAGGDDLLNKGQFLRCSRAEFGEKFFAEGDEGGLGFGREECGAGIESVAQAGEGGDGFAGRGGGSTGTGAVGSRGGEEGWSGSTFDQHGDYSMDCEWEAEGEEARK